MTEKDKISQTPLKTSMPTYATPESTEEKGKDAREEGVYAFKIGLWEVFSKDTAPTISARVSMLDTTVIDLIAPDGIVSDSVKYEISKMAGETIWLKMDKPLTIPQVGKYKLIATHNGKEVLSKEFEFKGFNIEVSKWEPSYKRKGRKLYIKSIDIFMKNKGDIPIYFKKIDRLIAGGNQLSVNYLKDIKIDPKKEFLMVSQSFDRPVEIEESGELVLYLEDVSSNIHKFSTKVNVGE